MASSKKHQLDGDDTQNNEQVYEPEPADEGMVVKQFCECPNCVQWTNSADWVTTPHLQFEATSKKTLVRKKKKHPLVRSAKNPGKTPKIVAFKPNELTKVERHTVVRTLVHGEFIHAPVKSFTDTYFNEDIQLSLQALNYKYSLPLQSFAWPAIFRQMNVFMIGGPKSGKTMAYLPAICTFSTMSEQKYEELSKYKGPLIVIICSNSKQCEEILDLIRKLYNHTSAKPKVSIMTYPLTNVYNTDILITIPDALLYCLKSKIFNLKRLCHLVLEDASTMLKNVESSIYQILEVVDEMLEHRPTSTKVQLIVTSEKWTSALKKMYKSIYLTPLICIANYLEAALYGNINFEVKFIPSEEKQVYLTENLKNDFSLYKTIVICNSSDLIELNKCLVRSGIKTIAISDEASKEEIEESETEWNYSIGGQYKVLLCTDFVFDTLICVSDAMWLINYSFPATWTRFAKRFSALSSHYKSPWEPEKEMERCKSLVMIDETCEEQMMKILNFLNRLTKDMPANYLEYAETFEKKTENKKIDDGVSLCKTLKLFGKCSQSLCDYRHLVKEEIDVSEDLPQCGKVLFKILNMKEVTQYTCQLIEHIDLKGRATKINNDDLKKPLVCGPDFKPKRPQDIKIGHFYAHCDNTLKGPEYILCHVISVQNEQVEVKLTTGLPLQTLKKKLFEVPHNIKIVDIYLYNLVPPFKDACFSGRSFHVARTSLESADYKSLALTGDIFLQLDGTLWLNNVVQKLKADGIDVIKFNMTKHLINQQVVEQSRNQITHLHKLCEKCDIWLPTYVKQTERKSVRNQEVEPRNAFLDDNTNEVILSSAISPDEFYVRLAKFQDLLQNLEKDIQDAVKTQIPNEKIKVELGKHYLALDPSGEIYSRVLVLNAEGNKVLCYYVDYGDEAVVEVSTLKMLPSKFISKLPFQAIQCRLFGLGPAFGEWCNEATDVLYKFINEPDSDIFRSLYVEVRTKDDGDSKRAKTKYSVLLKDGYGDTNVLINQLLLDCGYATSIFHKIDDFEIPKPQIVDDSDSDSDYIIEDDAGNDEEDIEENLFDDVDFELFDVEEFLGMLGMPTLNQMKHQLTYEAIEEKKNEKSKTKENGISKEATPLEVSTEKPTCLTPEVFWSQKENTVRLKIKLIGVGEYKTNVVQRKIFTFSAHLEGKYYALKFVLHKAAEIGRHRALGQEVEIILTKTQPEDWFQLTGSKKRMRFIHYELSETEEEKPKKFLQLDITDDESEDDGKGPMFHEVSDLDSDLDYELKSSSGDSD